MPRSIKIEICGPSPRCLFLRKELFVYFSESHRDYIIALREEILLLSTVTPTSGN